MRTYLDKCPDCGGPIKVGEEHEFAYWFTCPECGRYKVKDFLLSMPITPEIEKLRERPADKT